MAHINEIIVMVKMPATTATITIFSSTTIYSRSTSSPNTKRVCLGWRGKGGDERRVDGKVHGMY